MCTNSPQCFILTLQGQLVRRFTSGKKEGTGGDFNCATMSPQGVCWCVSQFGFVVSHLMLPVSTLQGLTMAFITTFSKTVCDVHSDFSSFVGKWLYCVGEDGVMYIFDARSGQLENTLQVSTHCLLYSLHSIYARLKCYLYLSYL